MLGNIKTVSGDGSLVVATGDEGFTEDGKLTNVAIERVHIKQRSSAIGTTSIIGGDIQIDLAAARYYEIDVTEDITSITVLPFDKSVAPIFTLKCNDTGDDYTYEFGDDFFYANKQPPQNSVDGLSRVLKCVWFPSEQRFFVIRQQ